MFVRQRRRFFFIERLRSFPVDEQRCCLRGKFCRVNKMFHEKIEFSYKTFVFKFDNLRDAKSSKQIFRSQHSQIQMTSSATSQNTKIPLIVRNIFSTTFIHKNFTFTTPTMLSHHMTFIRIRKEVKKKYVRMKTKIRCKQHSKNVFPFSWMKHETEYKQMSNDEWKTRETNMNFTTSERKRESESTELEVFMNETEGDDVYVDGIKNEWSSPFLFVELWTEGKRKRCKWRKCDAGWSSCILKLPWRKQPICSFDNNHSFVDRINYDVSFPKNVTRKLKD